MIKKRKGFSLAEVLITLMIVGVVAAATIPTVTKRTAGHDKLWDWADYPLGSTYFAGSNVLLDGKKGNKTLPAIVNKETMSFSEFFPDVDDNEISEADKTAFMENFKPQDDKLILVNSYTDDKNNLKKHNSFMSFYNIIDKGTNQYEYAGALSSDKYNLSLGAGALERLFENSNNPDSDKTSGYFNTAIGHLVSMSMTESSHTTTMGRYNLIEFTDGHLDCEDNWVCPYKVNDELEIATYRPAYNVAIGNKAQNYNMTGIENTAVGYRALNGLSSTIANVNVGIGVESLGALGSGGNPEKGNTYLSRNIGIGYRAGYQKKKLEIPSDVTYQHKSPNAKDYHDNVMRLFLTDSDVQPFNSKMNYNANSGKYGATKIGGSEFDMSADEIIINTADGKHTILKIDLTGQVRKLPQRVESKTDCESGYSTTSKGCQAIKDCYSTYGEDLGYCTGEGSEDLKKLSEDSNDVNALADVCIAVFENIPYVHGAKITASDTLSDDEEKGLFKFASDVLKLPYTRPTVTTYNDWDIYMKGLDVGFNGGSMTGNWKPAHIQTVKASLNYLDTWKEGQGVLSSAWDAFKLNVQNFFNVLFGGVGGFDVNGVTSLEDLIKQAINGIIEDIEDGGEAVIDMLRTGIDKLKNISDARLKDVSGESTAGLKEINALKIKNYTYKADKNKTPHVGVIAQELQKVFPNSVIEGADGYLRIKQEEMFFAMVNAIQELDVQDKELKQQIPKANKDIKKVVQKNKTLISKNEKLKAENERLNAQLKLLEDKK